MFEVHEQKVQFYFNRLSYYESHFVKEHITTNIVETSQK